MSTTMTAPTTGLTRRKTKLSTQQRMAALHLARLDPSHDDHGQLTRRVELTCTLDVVAQDDCQTVDMYIRSARTLIRALHAARGHVDCLPDEG